MPRFLTDATEDLKKYIYHSCLHDSKIQYIRYHNERIVIEVYNPIFDTYINFTFCGIEIVFSNRGNFGGESDTIHSLTVEDASY